MLKSTILILLLTWSLIGQSQETKLHLVSDVWPPFTNVPGQQAFAIELVKESLNRSGVIVQNEVIEDVNITNYINEKKFDGSSALWRSADREKTLIFSAPYLQNQLVLVGKKGSDVSAASFSELKGKKVAIVNYYDYGSSVDEASQVEFIKGVNQQKNLDKLLKGEVDYILVDALMIQYLLNYQSEEVEKYLEVGEHPLVRRSLHFALRKDVPNAKEIIEQFNKEVVNMVVDGSYNRILQINWIRADVDGDGRLEMVQGGRQAGMDAPTSSYDVWLVNSNGAETDYSDEFYVDGNFYENWDNIPQEYKSAPITQEDVQKVTILDFNF